MTGPARRRVRFGYWTDPLCIWALVSQPKLDRLLEELGDDLDVDHRTVPVFGSVSWRLRDGPWAGGGVDGRVEATRRIAREHGRDDVSGEVWRLGPTSSWAPGAAVKAVFAAEAAGEAPGGCGAVYERALRERFFADDRDVTRRDEQLAVAEALSIPRAAIERRLDDGSAIAALWEDHRLREALHIQGSPTYVFDDGRAMLYGDFRFGVLRATAEQLVQGLVPGASRC